MEDLNSEIESMRKRNLKIQGVIWCIIVLMILIACERSATPSLYVENEPSKSVPVISTINPPLESLAGIGQITIVGQNFSTIISENIVFFGSDTAQIISASATELVVESPNLPRDSLQVKIAVDGAFEFSNIAFYTLRSVFEIMGEFGEFDDAFGIAVDSVDNLYVSLQGKKIVKITPQNEQSEYATTLVDKASAMKFGPDGHLYYVNILSFVLRVLPGGGTDELFTTVPGGVFDLDFDQFGNLYAGGSGEAVYRVKSDKSKTVAADYSAVSIRTVRVFNDYLYVGGQTGSPITHKIWRNQIISADSLGPNELYFDWSGEVGGGTEVLAVTFADDGDMYVGTNASDAIYIIHPDKSYEPLYPGIISPFGYALSWGNGEFLFLNRRDNDNGTRKNVLKVLMRKTGAPYYGR